MHLPPPLQRTLPPSLTYLPRTHVRSGGGGACLRAHVAAAAARWYARSGSDNPCSHARPHANDCCSAACP